MLKIGETKDGFVFSVRLLPRASRTEICGCRGDSLKIRVVSPPLQGRANKECVEFLARQFGVSKARVKLIAGEKSRDKQILISGLSFADLVRALDGQGVQVLANEQNHS